MSGPAAQRADQLRLLGRLDEAERTAREGLADAPQDPGLLTVLAAVLLSAGRHADGLAAAEAAVAVAPQAERAHRLRALHLSGLGRHREAVDAATAAVALAPHEPYAHTAHARVLQRAGRRREAVAAARRHVELAPDSADAHFLLADAAGDARDRRTARRAYTEALRLDPQHAAARHDLAVLDLRSRRATGALRGFVDAGALDPTIAEVLPNVAGVLWRLTWRLRMALVVATIACIASAGPRIAEPHWPTRITAAVCLLLGALVVHRTVRRLPAGTGRAARAALRADRPLAFTTGAIALCVLLLALVAVTGLGVLAAPVWLVLGLLGVLALVVGLVRRFRRV